MISAPTEKGELTMPNTREKMIELLDNFPVRMEWHNNDELADHLIANGVTVAYNLSSTEPLTNCQQWIPVTKMLPNTGAVVLVFSNKDGVNIGKYVGYGGFVVRKWDIHSKPARTTHWMPLPQPPKENDL